MCTNHHNCCTNYDNDDHNDDHNYDHYNYYNHGNHSMINALFHQKLRTIELYYVIISLDYYNYYNHNYYDYYHYNYHGKNSLPDKFSIETVSFLSNIDQKVDSYSFISC